MTRPTHDDFRRDAKSQCVHNERPAGDMGCHQLPFRKDFFMPGVALEIDKAGWRIEPGKFSKVFQPGIHLFVADNGQCHVPRERNVCVFVKDCL